MTTSIYQQIANELNVREAQVTAAVTLLDDGNTVPFIARYRKEVTNGLDDTQLRNLESRLGYLRELEDRRQVILKSIDEQGKLTDALKKDILDADSKNRLEDLYLPYKPKRRTKGRSPLKPVSNRWRPCCGNSLITTRNWKRRNTSTLKQALPIPKPCWTAPVPS